LPSVISHAVVGIAAGKAFAPRGVPKHFVLTSVVCAVIPDLDVIGFFFGFTYDHLIGHRGFFHSPFFSLFLSLFIVSVFFSNEKKFSIPWWSYVFYFFLLSSSHGILDAFTNGGGGVALLYPFDDTRYFFPWSPIMVSPLNVKAFISNWGLMVIKTELLCIWIPSLLFIVVSRLIRNAIDKRVQFTEL